MSLSEEQNTFLYARNEAAQNLGGKISTELEKKIALREWKNVRGFAGDVCTVNPHFVGFRIDFDVGSGAVVNHVFFADAAAIADRPDNFLEP